MGNGRKTTDNRQPLKDNGQRSKDAVNGPDDCLFLWVFISYYVGLRRSTLRLYSLWYASTVFGLNQSLLKISLVYTLSFTSSKQVS